MHPKYIGKVPAPSDPHLGVSSEMQCSASKQRKSVGNPPPRQGERRVKEHHLTQALEALVDYLDVDLLRMKRKKLKFLLEV